MPKKPDGPGITKWKARVKLIHAKERVRFSSLTSDEAAQRSLLIAQARRCTCPDGPERFWISASGCLHCTGCSTNLDSTKDPLVYTPWMPVD